jgi:hypothetical protein
VLPVEPSVDIVTTLSDDGVARFGLSGSERYLAMATGMEI